VRGLEQRVAPELEQRIARIRRTLEERQREEHLRLKHILRKRLMEDAYGGSRGVWDEKADPGRSRRNDIRSPGC
jgi:hypothetical protein